VKRCRDGETGGRGDGASGSEKSETSDLSNSSGAGDGEIHSRAPRRSLTEAEGEALSQRLSEPSRNPTPAMVEALRAHKLLTSERSAR